MSKVANITANDHWFQHEAKSLRFAIEDAAGAPLPLTGVSLRWILLHGTTIKLTKTSTAGITVEGDDDEIAVVFIDEGDYATANVGWGLHHHMLIDEDADAVLSYGDAYLHPRTLPL